MHTITIYLIGMAGSGKYTIAQELIKYGFKIIDNHLINNPILSLLILDGVTPIPEKAWIAIDKIRDVVLKFIENDSCSNYVFTNELLEKDYDHKIYNKILDVAKKRNSIFIPIKFVVSKDELMKRIVSPERKSHFKATDIKEVDVCKESIRINHVNLLELDITNLNAKEAAEQVMQHVRKIKKT